jgi:hypothetical protein
MPVPPVAVSLPQIVDAEQPDFLASAPFRSRLSIWPTRALTVFRRGRSTRAKAAALTVLLIGIGFLAGRMTAPGPASPSSAAAQAAAPGVATEAVAASPAAPVTVAPPTVAPDPGPTDKPVSATPAATEKPPSTQSEPPRQPTAIARAAAPVVTATPPPPIDPLVQAVQQDIQQELESRKKH